MKSVEERALEIIIERCELESCFYCPFNLKETCNLIDGSNECLQKLKNIALEKAKQECAEG